MGYVEDRVIGIGFMGMGWEGHGKLGYGATVECAFFCRDTSNVI